MSSTLMTHCGARLVSQDELRDIAAPEPEGRWYPLPHGRVFDVTVGALERNGFSVKNTQLALSGNDARFFGTLDLSSDVCDGVGLCVGIRNSVDKSFPIGFCCGERVFVCDNLAFSSQIEVARKHTRNAEEQFITGVESAVLGLHGYQIFAAKRVEGLQETVLKPERADSIILRAYRKDIVGARLLPRLCEEWEKPGHEEFQARTAWSLLNCFTEVLKDRQLAQPSEAAVQTIRFHRLLQEERDEHLQTAV